MGDIFLDQRRLIGTQSIDRAKQGRLIAHILVDPAAHAGKTYPLSGPLEMDYHGVAAALSEELGRTIVYQPMEIADYRRQLESKNMPEQMIQHLCAVAEDYRAGLFRGEDRVIEQVTGIPPMTVQAFAEAHRDHSAASHFASHDVLPISSSRSKGSFPAL